MVKKLCSRGKKGLGSSVLNSKSVDDDSENIGIEDSISYSEEPEDETLWERLKRNVKRWFGRSKKRVIICGVVLVLVYVIVNIGKYELELRFETMEALGVDDYRLAVEKLKVPREYVVSYKDFYELAMNGEVARVIDVDYGRKVLFYKEFDNSKDRRNDKEPFNTSGNYAVLYETDGVSDFETRKELSLAGIKVVPLNIVQTADRVIAIIASLLTAVIYIGFLLFIMFKLMNRMTSNMKIDQLGQVPRVRLSDVVGVEDIKRDIESILAYLENPKAFKQIGAKPPRGILLYGPPGCGKTMLAKAIAGEAKIPFYAMAGSDFDDTYVGVGASRVRMLFKKARKHPLAIVFIDELDAIAAKRKKGSSSYEVQSINALLKEMDGFSDDGNIVVIGATNRIDELDAAIKRPGRFDRQIGIALPDKEERIRLIELTIKGQRWVDDINIEELSSQMVGFSGADIVGLINEAAFIAASRKKDAVDMECVDEAFYRIHTRGSKKSMKCYSDKEKRIVAVHEGGHTLVSLLMCNQPVSKVTIIPSTSGVGGATFSGYIKDANLMSRGGIQNMVRILYAGRCAEVVEAKGNIDEVTCGASNDIERATNLLLKYVAEYGMSETIGLLNMSDLENKEVIYKEANQIAKKLYEEVVDFIVSNSDKLNLIVEALLKQETLTSADLKDLLGVDIIESQA